MSSTPTTANPGLLSVANLLASIQQISAATEIRGLKQTTSPERIGTANL
jgi:hypothetical protein